ncbi:MAG: hydroxymethylglutaryl-CoA synthase [Deferribacterota bacterium]|nr:hydroxymethylglutaryl-CoA synthase [Deferribacterota bacterium]
MIGISGYGCYIPKRRIKVEEIARVWGDDSKAISDGLMVKEKTVPAKDEDNITISYHAGFNAIQRAEIDPSEVGTLYIGSESPPYAVKPSGTIVADALGIAPEVHVADYEFACKAGSEAVFTSYAAVKANLVKYAMGIGADTSQGAPKDALEYTAAAGGAAFIIGSDNVIAEILETYSYTTDTPDFWRRDGQEYPTHTGSFTGYPAYFHHTLSSAKGIMKKAKIEPKDINYAVFHQPNGAFPLRASRMLGFSKEQFEPGLIATYIGNTYSGCSLLGLVAVLDIAKEGEVILVTSFGSGAGSDSFILKVTDRLDRVRKNAPLLKDYLDNKMYVDYATYAFLRGKIKMRED